VSALASCQSLHTLYLDYSQVSDVTALGNVRRSVCVISCLIFERVGCLAICHSTLYRIDIAV
jgi:hypothetical protein